ncbi:MAG: DegT/DnrJ/EryC1/StrS family aminotransferase [Elusimicrobiota bacterium]
MTNIPDTRVPYLDLKAQYSAIRPEIDKVVSKVIVDSAFIGGPFLKAFEEEFCQYCGTAMAVGVSNGTDAVRLALLACGVGPGDEVITVPNTFIATSEAITMTGAKVKFVDIDPQSRNMDVRLLEAALTPKTKALLPVHLYGRPADMNPILEIAKAKGLRVVSDGAQAHGARYRDRGIGQYGDATTFSFYPGKNLGAYGDAGAVITDDAEIARKIRMLRDHGRTKKYEHEIEGFNCRMDGIQAAVLSVKLRYLDGWTELRQKHAARYCSLLRDIPEIQLPLEDSDTSSVHHIFAIEVDRRDEVQAQLQAGGIETGIHYPIPLHLQPAYSHLKLGRRSFPVAEAMAQRALSLPMFPELTNAQIDRVAEAVRSSVRATAA